MLTKNCNSGIFLDLEIYYLEKPIFWDIKIQLVNIYRFYYFWGVFSDSEQFFFFSVALTKKKVRADASFPPQNQSKLANKIGRNHCEAC